MLTRLFNSLRQSLVAVAIFHATADIAFICDAATPAVVGAMGVLITVWGMIMVVGMKPRDLSRIGRVCDVEG